MRTSPITVVVLAKNEAAHLKALLPGFGWAREVIVIDDNSTDETAKIALSCGAKVYTRALHDNFAAQRNFGLTQASQPWVLFVDADERVSPALVTAITQAIRSTTADGFYIPRRDVFLGKRLRFGETGNVTLLRLGKKTAGVWQRLVHEVWNIPNAQVLKTPLLHYAHPTIADLTQSVRRYSALEAHYRYDLKVPWSLWQMAVYPLGKFIYTFFWQKGFLDGYPGFIMSVYMSYHSWLVRLNLLKLSFRSSTTLTETQRWFWWLQGLIFLLLPFGQLVRFSLTASVNVYVFEILMMVTLGGFPFIGRPTIPWVWRWWFVTMAAWALSLLINVPLLGQFAVPSSLYFARVLLYGFWGLCLSQMTKHTGWNFPISRILIYVGMAFIGGGLIQYVVIPDMRFLYAKGWDDHYYRLVGTLFDPNFMGLIAALTTLLLLESKILYKKWGILWGLIALALTFSRGSYVVFGLSVGCFAVLTKQWKFGLVVLALGVLILFAPKPGGEGVNLTRVYSIISRGESWETAWNWFLKRPVWGMGFNAYKYVTGMYQQQSGYPIMPSGPDNSYLLVLATTGMVGMIPWTIYITYLLIFLYRSKPLFISMVAILLHSLINNSWFYPWIMIWVYLLLIAKEQENFIENSSL